MYDIAKIIQNPEKSVCNLENLYFYVIDLEVDREVSGLSTSRFSKQNCAEKKLHGRELRELFPCISSRLVSRGKIARCRGIGYP